MYSMVLVEHARFCIEYTQTKVRPKTRILIIPDPTELYSIPALLPGRCIRA